MKKVLSLVLAVLVAMSLPMTVLAAITVDTSYGNAWIGDTTANYFDDRGSSYTDVAHGGEVNITHGSGTADGSVYVDVSTGDLTVNGGCETYINANGDADVTVNGNINGELNAYGNADVTVNGSVYGEVAYGVPAVTAGENAQVHVTGSIVGADLTTADAAAAGPGAHVMGNATLVVDGSVTGGDFTGTSQDQENMHGTGGAGVFMQNTANVTVKGDVLGGDAHNYGFGGEGVQINVVDGGTAGSLTVGGSVSAGSGPDDAKQPVPPADLIIVKSPFGDPEVKNEAGVDDVPAITVGSVENVHIHSHVGPNGEQFGFTEEEAKQIMDSIVITNPSKAPTVTYVDEATARRSYNATNGYSKGALWRNGYITRTLFKVENGKGMKPVWEEELKDGVLTITAQNEPVVITFWLEGLKILAEEVGVKTIVVKTANCETELVLAELIAMNGTEYVLTQEGETAELTVDGKTVEI